MSPSSVSETLVVLAKPSLCDLVVIWASLVHWSSALDFSRPGFSVWFSDYLTRFLWFYHTALVCLSCCATVFERSRMCRSLISLENSLTLCEG